MTAAELIAIVEPHRELLRGLGIEVRHNSAMFGVLLILDARTDHELVESVRPKTAALVLEAVVRRELDEWAAAHRDRHVHIGRRADGTTVGIIVGEVGHRCDREKHELTVGLSLLAWATKEGA